ncbi:aldose 1-epimerase [Henriciella sp.]|uniref:aldose 1-epimerase n=1 Tax=Henriciella sp. TaxID=1968823 RepID=UPI0026136364|nr:aldose 1-epimerase [Henriciella sp.]
MSNSVSSPAGEAETSRLHLSAHGFDMNITPAFGGRIDRLSYLGQDILAPRQRLTDPDPLDAGSFALVPFSNRIRNGQFSHEGRTYTLPPNWTGDANAIHGEGWQRTWHVTQLEEDRISLYLQGTDWWPWRYECEQHIRFREAGVDFSLSLTNRDTQSMPAGLGFHPYFPRTGNTQISFAAEAVWPPMSDGPLHAQDISGATRFSEPKQLDGLVLDHCFEGWRGPATILQPDHGLALQLTAQGAPGFCMLYVPDGPDFFCFEPVSHLTGAFELKDRSRTGLACLEPWERLDFTMSIGIRELF